MAAPTGVACRLCGGEMIAGVISVPVLGSFKFSYRVRTTTVDTEIEGLMCAGCGGVVLTARDPERIRRAHDALRRADGGT
ncbi:MAG: hypothetical protein ACREPA_04400 [Candidatus Dormibacteraceae bacterium]